MIATALGEDVKVEAAKTNALELAKTNAVEVSVPVSVPKLILRKEAVDERFVGKATLKGPVVVFTKKQNPLAVFNPFRPGSASEESERPLRDPYLGAPNGIVLFSVHR